MFSVVNGTFGSCHRTIFPDTEKYVYATLLDVTMHRRFLDTKIHLCYLKQYGTFGSCHRRFLDTKIRLCYPALWGDAEADEVGGGGGVGEGDSDVEVGGVGFVEIEVPLGSSYRR